MRLQSAFLENLYWSDHETLQQNLILDQGGLFIGLSAQIIVLACAGASERGRAVALSTLCIQLLQLLWIKKQAGSYHRLRLWVGVVQRIRWLAMHIHLATSHSPATGFQVEDVYQHPLTAWSALTTVLLTCPGPVLLSAVAHPLAFRQQLFFSVITPLIYALMIIPHQVQVLRYLQLQPVLESTCSAFRHVLVPFATAPTGVDIVPAHCSPGNEALFLLFVLILLGSLLPLSATYLHEASSKKAFLQRLQQERSELLRQAPGDAQHDTAQIHQYASQQLDTAPVVHVELNVLEKTLLCWAVTSICWSGLGIMNGAVDQLRHSPAV